MVVADVSNAELLIWHSSKNLFLRFSISALAPEPLRVKDSSSRANL